LGGWKKEKLMTTMNQGNSNRLGTTPTDPLGQGNLLRRQTSPLSSTTTTATTTTGITPKFVPTLTEDDAVVQARLLKALADPTRLRILSLLSRHEGEVCVFEIVESFTLEQPTISHHLRILRDAGLVDCRKKGLWAYYYVRRDALSRAQSVIENLA
jgi:ArsR family transcriptional regulator